MVKETGFPSPAQGYEAKSIDLNKEIVSNVPATYFFRYTSSDLLYLGIFPDSRLVIDRSIKPRNGSLVVFAHEGRFRLRKWQQKGSKKALVNGQGEELPVGEDTVIFGVVKAVIREMDT